MSLTNKENAYRRLEVLIPQLVQSLGISSAEALPCGLVIIVGGAVLDIQAKPSDVDLQRGTSVPGKVDQVPGGVARNIAEGLSRLLQPPYASPMLVTLVGDDAAGSFLLSRLRSLRLDLSLAVQKQGVSTPCVAVAFDMSGEVAACVADVATLEEHLVPSLVSELLTKPASSWDACRWQNGAAVAGGEGPDGPVRDGTGPDADTSTGGIPHPRAAGPSRGVLCLPGSSHTSNMGSPGSSSSNSSSPIRRATLMLVEANLSEDAIKAACVAAVAAQLPIFMEPVSVPKSVRCLAVLPYLAFVKPNAAELVAMADELRRRQGRPPLQRPDLADLGVGSVTYSGSHAPRKLPPRLLKLVPFAAALLAAGVRVVVLTMGAEGSALLSAHDIAGEHSSAGGKVASLPGLHPQQKAGVNGMRREQEPGFVCSMTVFVSHMEVPAASVVNLSGAGDALVAGMVAGLVWNLPSNQALAFGMATAKLAVQCVYNVPTEINFAELKNDAEATISTLTTSSILVDI